MIVPLFVVIGFCFEFSGSSLSRASVSIWLSSAFSWPWYRCRVTGNDHQRQTLTWCSYYRYTVSTRFKTRCLNFFQIFPVNVIKTHTTFYSLVCCYWDAVSFARFWEAIEVILLRKSQISPENFKVDIWKQILYLKANIWRQILYLKAKNPFFGEKRRANRPLLRTDRD